MDQAKVETVSLRSEPVARFGAFELRLLTGELRKHGVRVRLQTKPFQLVRALIEQAGDVVTREELKERLWASDTFVDFESGLNTAVNRLRAALSDSAEHPIYVETLSRVGYRFIAPVVISGGEPSRPHGSRDVKVIAIGSGDSKQIAQSAEISHPSSLKWVVAGCISVFILCVAGALISNVSSSSQPPTFRQITFHKGVVSNARFTRDARNVLLSAEWNGEPSQLFLVNLLKPEARQLGLRKTSLAAVSPSGEVAIFASAGDSEMSQLETIRLGSGTPRKIWEHAIAADWAPDSALFLVKKDNSVFSIGDAWGRRIYTAKTGWISDLRVFSKNKIAFAEHPMPGDDAGRVMLINSSGEVRTLSSGWASLDGLAWNPSGHEVWFTAASSGIERALMAVDLNGHLRQIAQGPGGFQLLDIARSGQVLMARRTERMMMTLRDVDQTFGRDISWLDWSRAAGITSDGNTILFDESGSGGGKDYSVYLYRRRTNSAQRIGSGRAMDVSPDGNWVLTQNSIDATKLSLISVATQKSASIATNGLAYRWAKFLDSSDSPHILLEGSTPDKSPQIYRQRLPAGNPIPLNMPAPCNVPIVNATGQLAAASSDGREIKVFDLASGRARSIRTEKHAYPIAFLSDNEILASTLDHGSIVIESLNLQTGRSSFYRRVDSVSSSDTIAVFPLYLARDFRTLLYSRLQNLSDVFVVSGLK